MYNILEVNKDFDIRENTMQKLSNGLTKIDSVEKFKSPHSNSIEGTFYTLTCVEWGVRYVYYGFNNDLEKMTESEAKKFIIKMGHQEDVRGCF